MTSISSPRSRSKGNPITIDEAYARFPEAMAAYDAFAWPELAGELVGTYPRSEREAGTVNSDASWFVERGRLTCRSLSSEDLAWDGSEWQNID